MCSFNGDDDFFCFRSEIPFWGKFGPKTQNCLFKMNLVPPQIRIYRIQGDVRSV